MFLDNSIRGYLKKNNRELYDLVLDGTDKKEDYDCRLSDLVFFLAILIHPKDLTIEIEESSLRHK